VGGPWLAITNAVLADQAGAFTTQVGSGNDRIF